jgi:hypothetical protein
MHFITKNIIYTKLLLLLSLLSSCTGSTNNLGFNDQEWIDDKLACKGIRAEKKEAFEAAKEEMMGLSESELLNALGKPDKRELHKRGQKFYIYYLLPGGQCPDVTEKPGLLARIRFSALNMVNEISYENY